MNPLPATGRALPKPTPAQLTALRLAAIGSIRYYKGGWYSITAEAGFDQHVHQLADPSYAQSKTVTAGTIEACVKRGWRQAPARRAQRGEVNAMICFVEFRSGAALVDATGVENARRWAQATWGTDGEPYEVREATDADRAWVEGMGGGVQETAARWRAKQRAVKESR